MQSRPLLLSLGFVPLAFESDSRLGAIVKSCAFHQAVACASRHRGGARLDVPCSNPLIAQLLWVAEGVLGFCVNFHLAPAALSRGRFPPHKWGPQLFGWEGLSAEKLAIEGTWKTTLVCKKNLHRKCRNSLMKLPMDQNPQFLPSICTVRSNGSIAGDLPTP